MLLDAALLFGLFSPLNGRKIYSNLFLLFYGAEFLSVIDQKCNLYIVAGYGPCFQAILKPNQSTLKLFDILTLQNIDMVFIHPKPCEFLLALTDLYNADLLKDDILKQENFDKLFGHPCLRQVSSALKVLLEAKFLSPENFDTLIEHQTPAVFASECIRANSLDVEVIATFFL